MRLRNFWQMCSFQTSTGTRLMLRVEENMGAAAVDEEDELLLVFWRLAGGAVEALLLEEDILTKTRGEQNLKVASKSDRMPRNGNLHK